MSKKLIYLDYAAATPVSEVALDVAVKMSVNHYYHPSALYKGATLSADLLVDYRRRLSLLLKTKPDNLVLTSGATAANKLLISSLKLTYPKAKIACLNIDHDSIKSGANIQLSVDTKTAQITEDAILNLADNIICLSVAGINNELGIIQAFKTIKRAIKIVNRHRSDRGCLPLFLHVDASQMALVYNCQPQALAEADFVTYNGAKFYSFSHSGLLYIKDLKSIKLPDKNTPWQYVGSQSLPLTAAMTVALEMVSRRREAHIKRLTDLQIFFEEQLIKLGADIVLKNSRHRSSHITTAIMPNIDNETLVLKLSQANIYVGVGSACHSQTDLWQSSALRHLGYSKDQIYKSIRFSFAYETTKTQLKLVIKELSKILDAT